MTFESHPTPPGLQISQEDVVERLRDMAFRFSEAMQEVIGNGLSTVSDDDIETLNLAISLLGGKPVKLEDQGSEGTDFSNLGETF